MHVNNITVVGAGNMGRQIAMQAALSGFITCCTDNHREGLESARQWAHEYMAGRVDKGRISADEAGQALQRLTFTGSLPDALSSTDFVIEAVVEKLDIKRALFKELDALAPPHAILASNSSAIVSSKIADVTRRPDKVLNLHFFNPALVMKLVEVVQGPHVADQTVQIALAVCRRLNKEAVLLKKEVEGFLLNRILGAIGREASWLLEMGVASMEDIDKACVLGAGHPMGPFRLNDLTGLDLSYIAMMEKFTRTGDLADLPGPSLVEHYVKGEYGEKTGQGWYHYDSKTGTDRSQQPLKKRRV